MRSATTTALTLALLLQGAFIGTASAQLMEAAAATDRGGAGESPPVAPDLEEILTGVPLDGQAILVPIVGRFGTEVLADGFEFLAERRDALARAKALILDIDSEVGSDAEGQRIAAALETIRGSVPVIVLVRRAIGPAALLLPVADRVLIPEPALSGVVIAFQPECASDAGVDPVGTAQRYAEALAALAERSPRRDAWQSVVAEPSRWQLSSDKAYRSGIAEPLDGGITALGRSLRVDPWSPVGRRVEDVIRRGSLYAQQLHLHRSNDARAFASLTLANEVLGAVALAEQSASALDPRWPGVAFPPRLESTNGRWSCTASSVAAWNRACEQAAAAWERVVALCNDAERHLRSASKEIGALVSTATIRPVDPAIPEAIDRLERERAELETRIASLDARRREAAERVRTMLELRRR